VLALITDNKVECFNLGDSRLYHYNIDNNRWSQITKDHNLYNHLLSLYEKDNNIKLEDLYKQYANQLLALTRCLESNSNSHQKYDYFTFDMNPSDVLFLATDGVYNYIDIKDINNMISTNSTSNFSLVSKNIVQKALDNRSNDNLTSIIIESRMNNAK
jgi:serine/threonine protein phosphatase PrpC